MVDLWGVRRTGPYAPRLGVEAARWATGQRRWPLRGQPV